MPHDVCVIGGGPAGLAAAIALRMRGFRIVVRDARRPPIDKACGEGLLPGAFSALGQLGVDAGSLPGTPLRGIRFHGYGSSVAGPFPNGPGRGVRRTALHAALAERAGNCGVELRWQSPVSDYGSLNVPWIVGADGLQSSVRRWAGLGETVRNSVRFGFQRHYQVAPWSDQVEVYWSARGQAYVTPVGACEIGVAVLTRYRGFRLDDILNEFPKLSSRLSGANPAPDRGSVTAARRLRSIATGRVALVGDASGSVDAITGDGLALSFHQALALADALENNDLAGYSRTHRRLARRDLVMGDLMLAMDRFAFSQRPVLAFLAACPLLFRSLVGLHVQVPSERGTHSFLPCYR